MHGGSPHRPNLKKWRVKVPVSTVRTLLFSPSVWSLAREIQSLHGAAAAAPAMAGLAPTPGRRPGPCRTILPDGNDMERALETVMLLDLSLFPRIWDPVAWYRNACAAPAPGCCCTSTRIAGEREMIWKPPSPRQASFFGFLLVAESVFVGRVFEIKSRRNMHAVVSALCHHRSWASLLSSPPFDIFLLKKTPKPVHQHILAFLKLSVEYDGK